MRYHLNINPKSLDEDEWVETWVGLKWCLDESNKQFEKLNK